MKMILTFLFLFTIFITKGNPDSTISTTVIRNISIEKNKLIVSIHITKPNESGFARIYEKLPENSSVKNVKCGKAVYKNEKSMLKIVWDNIPADTLIIISYELKLSASLPDTLHAINGTFAAEYLPASHDQVPIASGKINYPTILIEESLPAVVKKEEIKSEIPLKEKELSNNSDTYICIQVAAVGSNINDDYLLKKFGYPDAFEVHFEENIYRITIGKFSSISEAEQQMTILKAKYFTKCFLSAYQNGKKIPVYKAEKYLN